jgi:hypothetical protein
VISGATVPAASWWVDGSVLAAVFFGGLFATALNNIFLARANKRLGPLVANMYVPVQPLCTATLDFLILHDAFYLANLLCGIGVITGLALVKLGQFRELREIGHLLRSSVSAGDGDAAPSAEEGAVLVAASERLLRRRSSVPSSSGGAEPSIETLLQWGDAPSPGSLRNSLDRTRGSLDRPRGSVDAEAPAAWAAAAEEQRAAERDTARLLPDAR